MSGLFLPRRRISSSKAFLAAAVVGNLPLLWFQDDNRPLFALGAYADQCRSENVGMLVENGFAADWIQGAIGGQHAMGNAAAEPESAFFVEIARIAHAMPNVCVAPVGPAKHELSAIFAMLLLPRLVT